MLLFNSGSGLNEEIHRKDGHLYGTIIHRKIYKLLEDDLQNGLHALEIKITN